MEILKFLNYLLVLPLRLVIVVYQKTLSPDHGLPKGLFPYGYCKFYPSCSAYAEMVLKKSGIIGLPQIVNRLIKCRPGTACAVDLPH
jgi:putative component of membrane protein insertase Oxa1/YidC/SpoIIIJ protein YidD